MRVKQSLRFVLFGSLFCAGLVSPIQAEEEGIAFDPLVAEREMKAETFSSSSGGQDSLSSSSIHEFSSEEIGSSSSSFPGTEFSSVSSETASSLASPNPAFSSSISSHIASSSSQMSSSSLEIKEELPGLREPELSLQGSPYSQDPGELPPDSIRQEADGFSMNLAKLTARDTLVYAVYVERLKLIQDSLASFARQIDSIALEIQKAAPVLAPKDEFEKQVEFNARKTAWETKISEKVWAATSDLHKHTEYLNKAAEVIRGIMGSMRGSLQISAKPEGTKFRINASRVGRTPAALDSVPSGMVRVQFRKDGYKSFDTTIQLLPGETRALTVQLEEKGIFSEKDEVDLPRLLARDSDSVVVYQRRIAVLRARQVQVDSEIVTLLAEFPKTYPKLEPKAVNETPEAFQKRRGAWQSEGMRLYKGLQEKHGQYRAQLGRAIDVLEDYILDLQSRVKTTLVSASAIFLGKYNADKETFEFTMADTVSPSLQFFYSGTVSVPLEVAKNLNRSSDGFVPEIQYLGYPFQLDSSSVYLAMTGLSMTHRGTTAKVNGNFLELESFKSMPGYADWRQHADSLLNGTLKTRGLDLQYALNDVIQSQPLPQKAPGNPWGWRAWTRLALAAATVAFVGVGIYENQQAADEADDANATPPVTDSEKQSVQDHDDLRNVMWICAGVSAGTALLTFAF